jgi:hypothetical protein
MRQALFFLLLAAVPALAQDDFAAAEKTVRARLLDPGSATFEDLRRASWKGNSGKVFDVVCGTVRAKNRFGGFVGRANFVYIAGDKPMAMLASRFEVLDEPTLDQINGRATHDRYCN